jgi:hypothetical protein
MLEPTEPVRVHLEKVLRDVCRTFPNGGDHEIRKLIAGKLLDGTGAGISSARDLRAIAMRALLEAQNRARRSG